MAKRSEGGVFSNQGERGSDWIDSDDEYRYGQARGTAGTRASIDTLGGRDLVEFGSAAYTDIRTGSSEDRVTIRGDVTESTISTENDSDNVNIIGAVSNSTITTGTGEDVVSIDGNVSGRSSVTLGDGRDRLTVGNVTGNGREEGQRILLDGGAGSDAIVAANITNTTILGGTGWDDITVQNSTSSLIDGGNDRDIINVNGDLNSTIIRAGEGRDEVTVLGHVLGTNNINLGDGDDKLTIASLAGINNLTINGGTGFDTLVVTSAQGNFFVRPDPENRGILTIYDRDSQRVAALPGIERVEFAGGASTQTQAGPGGFDPGRTIADMTEAAVRLTTDTRIGGR